MRSLVAKNDYPLLLNTLTGIQLGFITKQTSVLVLCGDKSSGNSLLKIIKKIRPGPAFPVSALHNRYNDTGMPELALFDNSIVYCSIENDKQVEELDDVINKPMIYRDISSTDYIMIEKPATVITAVEKLDVAIKNIHVRRPMVIHLSNQLDYKEYMIDMCVDDFNEHLASCLQ
jgi:hypothetical protein